ncbi:MAG: hypothetical protein IT492_07085 [Gammaproteobacteria bacterium]|nr:hypothetical protein [Gammaproteobacteria bacterium]
MRPILLVLLPLLLWANAEAVTFRYAEPPLGRLVFNQILDGAVTAPLRLPKIGEYYAELIIEAADGQQEVVLNEPLALSLDVSVARREHALLSRSVTVNFAPGERVKTLFWLNVPDHLPNRTDLEMRVSLRDAASALPSSARLRVQLTRKIEFSPIIVR